MEPATISSLLKRRNAWLKGESGDTQGATRRADLSRHISHNYMQFEEVRDHILASTDGLSRHAKASVQPLGPECSGLVDDLMHHTMCFRQADGTLIADNEGRKYLSGAWLEELAWLAAMEAGADEAIFGQLLGWKVKEYSGENEIDVIARKDGELSFVSCKALRSDLDIHDRKHRNRLMDAVHEADNLTDHFGRGGERVAVLVTTDLFDEMRGVARYNALMGKAAVLDVRIIPLEELDWNKLVSAMRGLWAPHEREGEML
jgi:Domain of unknown function (DUF1887)